MDNVQKHNHHKLLDVMLKDSLIENRRGMREEISWNFLLEIEKNVDQSQSA
jgi:hypothetical protein